MESRRLLFVVTEDWYFVSHRLSLAVSAREAGYDVTVATREANHGEEIGRSGIRVVPFDLSRRRGNPIYEIFKLVNLFRRERPDIIHLVAMKPVVYGGIAARITNVSKVVAAVAGLGWVFTSSNCLQRLTRPLIKKTMAWILSTKNFTTILQNPDDFNLLKLAGVPESKLRLIRGSGVDVDLLTPTLGNQKGPFTIMLVARMLWNKGVGDFVEAAKILSFRFKDVRFVLVGDPDLANPSAISESTLRDWNGKNGIQWWGRRSDMLDVLHQAHVACLPSYREGLPKSLLEAAAVGLPIVTTDVPGCREVVKDGFNGFLVPVRDPQALALALARLIENSNLRLEMGRASRELAIREFSTRLINQKILGVYSGQAI